VLEVALYRFGDGRWPVQERERRPAVVDFNVAGFRNETRRGFDRTATIRWGGGGMKRGRRCGQRRGGGVFHQYKSICIAS
jgi:hypothetical protein